VNANARFQKLRKHACLVDFHYTAIRNLFSKPQYGSLERTQAWRLVFAANIVNPNGLAANASKSNALPKVLTSLEFQHEFMEGACKNPSDITLALPACAN
jgi:hypothetical protein